MEKKKKLKVINLKNNTDYRIKYYDYDTYNLNNDSNGNPTDEKRLGLNYMLFYGLGYTFGRDK